jgi:DNA polymerase-3 subunit gamma/tau
LNLDTVLAGLDILTTAKAKLRGSPHVQVLVEVAVIRLARMDELLTVAQLVQVVAEGTSSTSSSTARPVGPSPEQSEVAGKIPFEASKKNALNGQAEGIFEQKVPVSSSDRELTFSAIWDQVLKELGPMLRRHLQMLELPAIIGPNTLAIRVPADYSAAYDALASDTGQAAIRQSLHRQTREEWSLRVERSSPTAGDRAQTVERVVADRNQDLLRLPLLQRASEVLGAQLVRVEDGFNPSPAQPALWTEPEPMTGPPDLDEG